MMIKVNFWVQNLLMVTAIALAIASLFDKGYLFMIFYLQMLVGVVQVVASIVINLMKRYRSVLSEVHLLSSILFLLLLYIVRESRHIKLLVFGAPWLLVLLFWYVSYQHYQSRKLRSV